MKRFSSNRLALVAVLIMALCSSLTAQSPFLISYQAVIRNLEGQPLINADKTIKVTILQGSTEGIQVFTETHSAHTNSFGLVNLQIGSITTGLESIDWTNGPYFLNIEVDATDMGTTQLISVPYAFYSKRAGNGFQGDSPYYINNGNVGFGTNDPRSTLTVEGTTATDSAIFEVKNNNGLTVLAVYNEGVRINIDETTKSAKGGFAIGGFSDFKSVSRDFLRISSDSIRMYINDTATYGKGAKGGFAIGGFDMNKTDKSRYMHISGSEGTNAGFNSFIGYKAGNPSGGGTHNISLGYYSGANIQTAYNNIFIGDSAGAGSGWGYENIFIGRNSGAKVYSGYNNVYLGYRVGSDGDGQYNVYSCLLYTSEAETV